ncbi:MAG TPA: hypothetical protein VEA80_10410 [Vitreimonas sp.]|uniref:hypothetical protein n=1 Tax=Vitreimonas sp. TaxID=3069702 RepID=UPI002D672CF5|nr:hypothetical protein [Vitreimonas sp.]HYD87878.1 hypothetical protein [Vitreimonas sp.]
MTTVPTFVTFFADFADDAVFNAAGDVERPGGNAIAAALCHQLAEEGVPVFPPVQHSFYGWAFATKPKGALGFVLQYVDPWLLICENQGGVAPDEFIAMVHATHRALVSDPRFSSVQWFTRTEFDKGAQGANEPV